LCQTTGSLGASCSKTCGSSSTLLTMEPNERGSIGMTDCESIEVHAHNHLHWQYKAHGNVKAVN